MKSLQLSRASLQRFIRSITMSTIVAIAVSMALTASSWADLVLQPANISSYLIPFGANLRDSRTWVSDKELATLTQNLLIKNGNSNVKDAKFFFQECFGGGMLDDLKTTLGNTVSWVGGSASTWFQPAYSNNRFGINAHGAWTEQLIPQLGQNQTVLNAINNAAANDPQRRIETGQSISANNGDTITLKDPAALSHHAIIFAGIVDRSPNLAQSIVNDVNSLRNQLQLQWQGTNFTITTLLGNGNLLPNTLPATKVGLQQAFTNLAPQINNNEEFLFFGHDHGSVSRRLSGPRVIGAKSLDLESLDLTGEELLAMQSDPNNIPTLTVEYSGLTAPVPVEFNGQLLGNLDPLLTEMIFDVPESLISTNNSVTIDNSTSSDFSLVAKDFTDGDISIIETVPEPCTFALFCAGIVCFLGYGWGRRNRGWIKISRT